VFTSTLEIYLNSIKQYPLLTKEEERDVARRAIRGDQNARETLIQSNLRLVVKIAKAFRGKGLSLEDLIQEGNIGLGMAADRFNPTEGRFTTHATWWIKQAIKRALKQNRIVHIPVYVTEMDNKVKQVVSELGSELGHQPSDSETQEALRKRNIKDVNGRKYLCEHEQSLPTGDGGDGGVIFNLLPAAATLRPDQQAQLPEILKELEGRLNEPNKLGIQTFNAKEPLSVDKVRAMLDDE